jgi:hypothetical protein
MGANQQRIGRGSTLVTSQWLLLVVVALALAAYAASTWYTRHMWNRVNDATDTFAVESVYGVANISAARETLWKVDALLHREIVQSDDLDLKTQVDELRSELGTEGDRLVGDRPERAEGGAVQFWVTDTGAGFDAESREHLFDRFWQAKQGLRHGVGLGLSIVKSIVEAHGGRVWVDGAPGLGSTFYFTLLHDSGRGGPAAPTRRGRSRPVEVVALLEVLDEPLVGRIPAHLRAGDGTRRRLIDREEASEPAEVRGGAVG